MRKVEIAQSDEQIRACYAMMVKLAPAPPG